MLGQYRGMIAGMPSLAGALATGPVVLDGGLSTELEERGHDVSSALWSARLLRDDPAAIVAAHAAFAAAGAQVATTASYQATVEGFTTAGVAAEEARRLIASSVALAREGQGGAGWVAGSVGPYGAMLADGSEYRGDYVDHLGGRGERLAGEHVGPRLGEQCQAWAVELPQRRHRHRRDVVAPVLRAVGQVRAVRAHGTGDPAVLAGGGHPVPGQLHGARDQRGRLVRVDAGGGEARQRGLVARRRRHLGAGHREGGVRVDDGLRVVPQQPGRPERRGHVVSPGLQLGGQPAVQDDDAGRQRGSQGDRGGAHGTSVAAGSSCGPRS